MERAVPYLSDEKRAKVTAQLRADGYTDADIEQLLSPKETWMNDRYVVGVVRDDDGDVNHLSIRSQTRSPIHDWRHLQRIKNEIAGPEIEAIELYPAESRLVDEANQFWLWCLKPGVKMQVGFNERRVGDAERAAAVGAKQRPFDD